MITVDIYRLPLPANLRRRVVNGHVLPYERHAEATVTRVRISSSRSASGANDLAWIANAPAVAPILATVPEPYRNDILRACVVAVEQVYRIPAARRAESERVGRAGWRVSPNAIPRRTNPVPNSVNRQVVQKNRGVGWALNDLRDAYLDAHNPAAAVWMKEHSNHPTPVQLLSEAVAITLSSPEGFPPLPARGDEYTESEVNDIMRVWLAGNAEWEDTKQRFGVMRRKLNYSGPNKPFDLPSDWDMIKKGVNFAYAYRKEELADLPPQQRIRRGTDAMQDSIEYYSRLADGVDRLGPDWKEKIDIVWHKRPADQVMDVANEIDILGGKELGHALRYFLFHSSQLRDHALAPDASIATIMRAVMQHRAEQDARSETWSNARAANLTRLRAALAPLNALDKTLTLRDVTPRLPEGFEAKNSYRNEEAQIVMPEGGMVYESQSRGPAKWDRLVRSLFTPGKW